MITDKETCGLSKEEIQELEEYGNRVFPSNWWGTTQHIKELREFLKNMQEDYDRALLGLPFKHMKP